MLWILCVLHSPLKRVNSTFVRGEKTFSITSQSIIFGNGWLLFKISNRNGIGEKAHCLVESFNCEKFNRINRSLRILCAQRKIEGKLSELNTNSSSHRHRIGYNFTLNRLISMMNVCNIFISVLRITVAIEICKGSIPSHPIKQPSYHSKCTLNLAKPICNEYTKHCSNFNSNSNKFDDCFDHFQNISITMKIYAASLQICEILSKWAHEQNNFNRFACMRYVFVSAAARSRPCTAHTHTHAHINRRPNMTDPLDPLGIYKQLTGKRIKHTHRCSLFACTYCAHQSNRIGKFSNGHSTERR